MTDYSHDKFADENPRCCCSEDDNCGCTYPENTSSYTAEDDIEQTQESFKIKTEEGFIKKDTVCYCSPKNCRCTIEYHESDY